MNIEYEVGFNLRMNVSVNGVQLLGMGEDNIYSVLDSLYNVLKEGAPAGELLPMPASCRTPRAMVCRIGRHRRPRNRLELIANRYEENQLMYTDIKSKLEDVDQAEALMNFRWLSMATMALQVGSRIVQPCWSIF